MIVFDKLWNVMRERGVSQYKLDREYHIGLSQINRLKKNASVTTYTLNRLCKILDCRLEDIAEYIPDPEEDK